MFAEASMALGPEFHMWVTFGLIVLALGLYTVDSIAVELTSIGVICALLVFFELFPILNDQGYNILSAKSFLVGFANPALITVLALLVVGQGMVRTGVLERGGRLVLMLGRGNASVSIAIALVTVIIISAFLNNIPVVVIFIPIMQMLAQKSGRHESKVMMGLSFAAVLGGMTTLIGSGTNLLVSAALVQSGQTPFTFFDFTIPGIVMAGVGLLYVLFIAPHLLPDRSSLASRIMQRSGKYFLAEIFVTEDSKLLGTHAVGSVLKELHDVRVRMVRRGSQVFMPPYHDLDIEAGDLVVVAASRQALTAAMSHHPELLTADGNGNGNGNEAEAEETWKIDERILAEVMVAPASRLVDRRISQIGFQEGHNCTLLGIQRRSHMFRSELKYIPLEAGDVLLVQGDREAIRSLENNPDVVLMEGTRELLPAMTGARRAIAIFLAVVFCAATGILPVVVAAITGAAGMIASGVLNIRQASRALDSKIVTMIPAALALGAAMEKTGGAQYLADTLLHLVGDAGPVAVLSGFFLLVAILANVLSSKACAVLFAPIGINLGLSLGVDPHIFAVALVFAANCAFATPIGYQTSLLVMGPGHYRFFDFTKAGTPLIILLWVVFTFFAPWYYGL